MTTVAPYGEWVSPITAADVARSRVRLSGVRWGPDGSLWWAETRPAEGGRTVVVRHDPDGHREDVLPAGYSARTRVHEYGGGAWTPVGPHEFVFASWDDQRLYGVKQNEVRPLTPAPDQPQGIRYADLVLTASGNEICCVRERATGATSVRRDLVAVALGAEPAEPRVLASDGHFLSNPRPAPDGRHLAWLTWEHPRMPWDGTELRVAQIAADGSLGPARTLAGGPTESLFQPEWVAADRIVVASDASGWWNLVEVDLAGQLRELWPAAEEFGEPAWVFGMATHGRLASGQIAAVHGRGQRRLSVFDPGSGMVRDLAPELTGWEAQLAVRGQLVAGVAGSATATPSVVVVDTASGAVRQVREPDGSELDPAYLPQPSEEVFRGLDGQEVHAIVYPPTNPDYTAPSGQRAPCVAFVHGGPTAQSRAGLDLEIAYFTSRGIGVADVNYGGSTGYGRAYRQRLLGAWGVVDVADVVSVLTGLAERKDADPARFFVRGGSAGGWTVLAGVTSTDVFAGGVSYYGVAELVSMASDTHDFESRYLDGLIGGSLPAARELWDARSPLHHVADVSCPVLLLQGLEDRIVPPAQAECFRDALAAKGIPHAYLAFAGEQHGFRQAATIVAALQAELSFYGQLGGFRPVGVPQLELSRDRASGPAAQRPR